jgi:hypothetical protein
LTASLEARSTFSRGRQATLDIGADVVDVLDVDRKAHIAIGHACRSLLPGTELRMGRRRWMNRKAAGVADIGNVATPWPAQAVGRAKPSSEVFRRLPGFVLILCPAHCERSRRGPEGNANTLFVAQ